MRLSVAEKAIEILVFLHLVDRRSLGTNFDLESALNNHI